jgi:hypothetical protein
MSLPDSHVQLVRSAIAMLLERLGTYLQACPTEPVEGSTVAQELATSCRPESIATALSFSDLAIEFACDHLSTYNKIIAEPIETLACFTCIRSMLETTAIAAWVLDPTISSIDRIARVFSVRFDAIDQQLKFGRCIGVTTPEIEDLETRLNAIEAEALALGYPQFRNTKNAIYAIGVVMPNATEVIRDVLSDEWLYRLLSAVAHGHHWAIAQLGFQDATPQTGPMSVSGINVKPMTKKVYVNGIVLLGLHGFLAFARLMWNKAQYSKWNLLRLEEIFEEVADKIQANPSVRFWRNTA